jgi:hypothetical protein
MTGHPRRILIIVLSLALALLGSGVFHAQAAPILPAMSVTLMSRGSTYTTTIDFATQFTFQAKVQNTGNVPLEIIANLEVPQDWDLNAKDTDCPESLGVSLTCSFTWQFTPHASGAFYLRVYTRGLYTDSSGNSSRITQSPAFLVNVRHAPLPQSQVSTTSTTSTSSTTTVAYVNPGMNVTLTVNDQYTYAATVYVGNPIFFRAQVKNTGNVPLKVTANLTVPEDWYVNQNKYSDCPDNLDVKDTCEISWYFIPQSSGQVFLRVYARGVYTTSSGDTSRITSSPAFIFNVKPAKSQ